MFDETSSWSARELLIRKWMVSRKQSWLSLCGKLRNSCWEKERLCVEFPWQPGALRTGERWGQKEDAKQQQETCKVNRMKIRSCRQNNTCCRLCRKCSNDFGTRKHEENNATLPLAKRPLQMAFAPATAMRLSDNTFAEPLESDLKSVC